MWWRIGRRGDGRAPLWIELVVIGWLFYLYDVVNNLAPIRQQLAVHDAVGLLAFEHSLHLSPELAINTWLAVHATLGSIASYYYFFAHGVVTFTVLALLWWKRPELYRRQRTLLVIINLIAFAVFWRYPLAPPRMFPKLGYVDVIATSHALVSWSSSALVHDADQLAAMPSLHIAWAIWSGLSLWLLMRRRVFALLGIAYPLLTALVVMGTANHYVLDVLAAAATVPLAFALQRGLYWLLARTRRLGAQAVAVPARGVRREPGVATVLAAAVAPRSADGEALIAVEEPRPQRRRAGTQQPHRGVRESA
ncbi:MAG TPA: phosphatase PAP2 family protein [Solirubrobacteraceae bacterium]|nr:phosphatase PAP2 family protein [Solirubrobacteraceae bacterium]